MDERRFSPEAQVLLRLQDVPCPVLPSAYAFEDRTEGPWQVYFGDALSARQWSEVVHRLSEILLVSGNAGAMHVSYALTPLGVRVAQSLKEHAPHEWHKLSSGKVFLSHSFKDSAFCQKLDFDLRQQGFETWFDLNDLLAGDSIPAKIDDGLSRSDFVIIVYTHNAAASRWVRKEYESALSLEDAGRIHKVIVVKCDDVELPPLLRTRRYVRFPSQVAFTAEYSKEYEASLAELVASLQRS